MNWSSLLSPFKYLAGSVVVICLVSGLVWFAATHWAICLFLIAAYLFFELLKPVDIDEEL